MWRENNQIEMERINILCKCKIVQIENSMDDKKPDWQIVH